MKKTGTVEFVGAGCLTFVIWAALYAAICFPIGAICATYAINAWLDFFEKETAIAWYQGGLIGMVPGIGQVLIPVALITWVIMLFV